MKRDIVKRTKAIWDIIELAECLGQDDPAIALRFIDAVEESLHFLQDFPISGSALTTSRETMIGTRLWQVKGFQNHIIIFKPHEGSIEVLRVCHGERNLDDLL